jgi:anti-anti-sigma regulatory factor
VWPTLRLDEPFVTRDVIFFDSIGMRLLVTTAKSLARFGHRCVLLTR